jgi:hypothetical protein
MVRLSYRSASTPPHSENSSDGPNCRASTMPTAVPELSESSRTSQSWATRCIQVPVSETTWPLAYSR